MLLEYREYGVGFHLFHPPLTKTASASPLPVPDDFKANPETVGKGLARNIDKKGFITSHSAGQAFQTRLMYLFPIRIGNMMTKMADRAPKQ